MANEFKLVKLLDPAVVVNTNFNLRGDYDNAETYVLGDIVLYEGVSYMASTTTTGNLPTDSNYWQVLLDPAIKEEFETVNKNLKSLPYSITYTGNKVSSIAYTLPSGTITKTLNYTGNKINTIVLSGDTPTGINLTKTFTYTGNKITSVAYL